MSTEAGNLLQSAVDVTDQRCKMVICFQQSRNSN